MSIEQKKSLCNINTVHLDTTHVWFCTILSCRFILYYLDLVYHSIIIIRTTSHHCACLFFGGQAVWLGIDEYFFVLPEIPFPLCFAHKARLPKQRTRAIAPFYFVHHHHSRHQRHLQYTCLNSRFSWVDPLFGGLAVWTRFFLVLGRIVYIMRLYHLRKEWFCTQHKTWFCFVLSHYDLLV